MPPQSITIATRYHDFSCGHRVYGHEGKCAHLHGHNYRVHFTIQSTDPARPTDDLGRVLDFDVIKQRLCLWLEVNWDHRMLLWERDPVLGALQAVDDTVVPVSFNPTAEAMAYFLLDVVGPALLPEHVRLLQVQVEETRKCSATAALVGQFITPADFEQRLYDALRPGGGR